MLTRWLSLLCIISLVKCKRNPYFVYSGLDKQLIFAARHYGATVYKDYLNATEEVDPEEREKEFPNFFEKCNDLGWDIAANVIEVVKNESVEASAQLLLKTGLQPFVAEFLTLDDAQMKEGIKQLCMKTELQFQCQLGFGESRSQIQLRIQNLKRYDGDMRLLLEKDCNEKTQEAVNYPCIGHKADNWITSCTTVVDKYNETRTANNDKIYTIYTHAVDHAEQIVKNADPDNEKQFIPTKIIVENIMKKALDQIKDLESEKCRSLASMTACILPELEKACGEDASDALKTSLLVGYLRGERGTALHYSFEQLEVDSDPICSALHRDI